MRAADAVFRELRAQGLLLQQDRILPSVVGIVTGQSLRGSWWGHPKGRLIFAVLSELADRHDVVFREARDRARRRAARGATGRPPVERGIG